MNLFHRAKQSIFLARGAIKICFVCIAIVLFTANLKAQTNTLSNVQLAIKGNLSLDSVTSLVHAKTGVRFSFNSVKISGSKIIFFPQANYSINHLLQHIHNTTGLYYFQYKKYYIFQDNPPKPKPVKTATTVEKKVTPKTKPSTKIAASKTTVNKQPVVKTVTVKPTSIVAKEEPVNSNHIEASNNLDTAKHIVDAVAILPQPTVQPTKPLAVDSVTNKNTKQVAKPQPPKAEPEPNNSLFHFQTGVFSTEVLYANAGVEIGIRPIHALLSFATNFDVSGPRIGLGSVIKNREQSQWQVKASICFLKKNYLVDSFGTAVPFTIKGQLYNAGIEWCKKMKSHLMFKAGLVFNLLKSKYYSNDVERVLGTFPFLNQDPDKKIYLLKPPYLISNSYSNTTTGNIKTWVGVSVGFYYTLPRN